jgi:hypothetical protein
MRTLWTKIGLGALGVFLVGMLLLTVVEDAKSTMKEALTRVTRPLHVATADLQADIPFVLAGQRRGTVNHMSIRRPADQDLAHFTFTVALDSDADLSQLKECQLVPVGGDDFEFEEGFRCAAKGESGWQEVGSIVFQPSGLERPVLAGSKVVAQLQKGDRFSADADFTGPVRVSAKSDKGELLHLKADSNGAFLLVNGKDGRAVVRLQADKNGFSLTVDTTGAH